jgi:hypothetical protein
MPQPATPEREAATPRVGASPSVAQAIDVLRYEALEEMAELAASYWRSVAEAAHRRELPVLKLHCTQIAAVTREAFAVVKSLDAPPATKRAP